MPLTIIFKDHTDQVLKVDWKIGTPGPFKDPNVHIRLRVGLVIASGEELDWVKVNITGVPIANKPEVQWHGDFAKFIAGNLP